MQFDDLDKKIQEAAERFHPVYDERAWNNMESMLDKRLPLKEKKKRALWLTFLLLLVTGIALLLWIMPQNKPAAPSADNDKISLPGEAVAASGQTITVRPVDDKKTTPAKPVVNAEMREVSATGVSITHHEFTRHLVKHSSGIRNHLQAANLQSSQPNSSLSQNYNIEVPTTLCKNQAQALANNEQAITPLKQSTSNYAPSVVKAENNTPAKVDNGLKPVIKKQSSFLRKLSFNLSAGADVSAVAINNIGKANIVYGAGLGYSFLQKWKLRTGLSVVKKIYASDAKDYHPPAKFWTSYPNLEEVSADCKVLEVPLVVDYTFKTAKAHSYFASAGFSSYFMKKETYHYFSEASAPNYQVKTMSISNANKHYFSSFRLAAGYERKFSGKISFIAEPYLNLPLSGVGYGKVMLKSAGVLFTVSVKP